MVDEVLVVALDAELPLCVLDLAALLEERAIHRQQLPPRQLALLDGGDQLPGVFQLLAQLPQLLRAQSVATSGLAHLAHLTPAEADVRIRVVRLLAGFQLARVSTARLS